MLLGPTGAAPGAVGALLRLCTPPPPAARRSPGKGPGHNARRGGPPVPAGLTQLQAPAKPTLSPPRRVTPVGAFVPQPAGRSFHAGGSPTRARRPYPALPAALRPTPNSLGGQTSSRGRAAFPPALPGGRPPTFPFAPSPAPSPSPREPP